MTSGGRVHACSDLVQSRRTAIETCHCNVHKCGELREENVTLRENLREFELYNEEVQPSKNNELARSLVEPYIKVENDRYRMPFPVKQDVIDIMPNNYNYALKRTKSLRENAIKNSSLKDTLIATFAELIKEGWIEPVEKVYSDQITWYLPFFVTKQGKPRVVYDDAATVGGVCLNQAVLAGTNLLNNLVEVLVRFRSGKYACIADLCRCLFQVVVPEAQRDLLRIIWFRNSDLEGGEPQVFRFSRHVWGINSSPYVALLAIKTCY